MRAAMSLISTSASLIVLASCAAGRDPGTTAQPRTAGVVAATAGELCQVEVANDTRGELEVYYAAGPDRARKLDKIPSGTDLAVAVPCDARYVTISAIGVDGRYAKHADLTPGAVTSVALNQGDRKRD